MGHLVPFNMYTRVYKHPLTNASVNWVILGSGNDLVSDRGLAITGTNTDLMSMGINQEIKKWKFNRNAKVFFEKKIHLKMSSEKLSQFVTHISV